MYSLNNKSAARGAEDKYTWKLQYFYSLHFSNVAHTYRSAGEEEEKERESIGMEGKQK